MSDISPSFPRKACCSIGLVVQAEAGDMDVGPIPIIKSVVSRIWRRGFRSDACSAAKAHEQVLTPYSPISLRPWQRIFEPASDGAPYLCLSKRRDVVTANFIVGGVVDAAIGKATSYISEQAISGYADPPSDRA